jgi:hypothetical protein
MTDHEVLLAIRNGIMLIVLWLGIIWVTLLWRCKR